MSQRSLFLALAIALVMAGAATAELSVVTNDGGLQGPNNPLDVPCVKNGKYAMRVNKTNGVTDEMYVEATPPKANFNDETSVNFEFWFNAGSMALPDKGRHWIVAGKKGDNSRLKKPFKAQFRRTDEGDPALRLKCIRPCATAKCGYTTAGTHVISESDWHLVRITWVAGTLDNGTCKLEVVEGAPTGVIEKADYEAPGWTIGGGQLGMFGPAIIESTGTGKHCYDDFLATRTAP